MKGKEHVFTTLDIYLAAFLSLHQIAPTLTVRSRTRNKHNHQVQNTVTVQLQELWNARG